MRKLILFLLMGILLISLVNAEEQSLGVFKKGSTINLKQVCSNCSYNNISSVLNPKSETALGLTAMVKSNTEYTYSFSNTSELGEYIVYGYGDLDGVVTTWAYSFEVTESGGKSSFDSTILIIIILIFGYILGITGSRNGEYLVSTVGGFIISGISVYIWTRGLGSLTMDSLPLLIGNWVNLAMGLMFMLVSALNFIGEK